MRAYCSSIAKFLRYTIFDGARFWVINAKKEHLLLYTMLDKNALSKSIYHAKCYFIILKSTLIILIHYFIIYRSPHLLFFNSIY